MPTITLFKIEGMPEKDEIIHRLDNEKEEGCWVKAKESRYNEDEIEVDVWYEEDIEVGLKRAFSDKAYEMIEYFKSNGKEKVVKKVYCFIDLNLGTLEMYRGPDHTMKKIKEVLESLLEKTLTPVSLDAGHLMHIVKKHSSELRQAMFKNIHGLWYHIIRGRHLENNGKYKDFIVKKPDSLSCVSVIPKIKYVNGNGYSVTINGNKGTIKMYDRLFRWKPRIEVKQIVEMVNDVASLPSF